jgi:hypothetical protein
MVKIGRCDYSDGTVPAGYACGTCGATGCKLWREYGTPMSEQTLSCAACAGRSQNKDVSDMDADGQRLCSDGYRTDQIGWRVPAFPAEDGSTFWGYTSVPDDGVQWWKRLPNATPRSAP